MSGRNPMRAARYRDLAGAEPDQSRSDILTRLAEEADRGVLFTSNRTSHVYLAHSEIAQAKPAMFGFGSRRIGFV